MNAWRLGLVIPLVDINQRVDLEVLHRTFSNCKVSPFATVPVRSNNYHVNWSIIIEYKINYSYLFHQLLLY